MSTLHSAKFQKLLADIRAKKAAEGVSVLPVVQLQEQIKEQKVETVELKSLGIGDKPSAETIKDVIEEVMYGADKEAPKVLGVARDITLNPKQQEFNDRVMERKNTVLIGAAGTGKTTCMRQVTRNLIDMGVLDKLPVSTKALTQGSPGAVILSFTRKAVNNIRHAVVDELKKNTVTIHRLLEFEPEFFEVEDPKKPGFIKKSMRFVPTRNKYRPLPAELTFVAFEESSMIGVDLYNLLQDALPHGHQEVFLGDIQQLPPVFGAAILGFKMLELPVVELTEIYRQAAKSPIISVAWKLLQGDIHAFNPKTVTRTIEHPGTNKPVKRIAVPALDALSKKTDDGSIYFQVWQKPLSPDHGLLTATKQFCAWESSGYYNPLDDIILCPYNQAFGTIELNKGIMQHLGNKRGAPVFEIIAGFNTHYLAVGDRVLYDKEDAFIVAIEKNGTYAGKTPRPPSVNLDRWGHYQENVTKAELEAHINAESAELDEAALDAIMQSAADEVEDRVQAASHVVTIRYAYQDGESDGLIKLNSASEINALLGGYAITVHKAQGSEWKKVFIVLHSQHAKMASRELLYTAITRARQDCHIICEVDTFSKGIKYQRIKGNTLKEKAEQFKGKLEKNDDAAGQIPVPSVPFSGSSIVRSEMEQVDTSNISEQTNAATVLETKQLVVEKGTEIRQTVSSPATATKELTLLEKLKAKIEAERAAKAAKEKEKTNG